MPQENEPDLCMSRRFEKRDVISSDAINSAPKLRFDGSQTKHLRALTVGILSKKHMYISKNSSVYIIYIYIYIYHNLICQWFCPKLFHTNKWFILNVSQLLQDFFQQLCLEEQDPPKTLTSWWNPGTLASRAKRVKWYTRTQQTRTHKKH